MSIVFAPKFKKSVRDLIEKNLFDFQFKFFFEEEQKFVDKHYALNPRSFEKAFRFRGTTYGEFKRRYQVLELHDDLKESFQLYLESRYHFYAYQHAPIMSMVTQALNLCKTPNDLLAILPTHTHSVFYDAIKSYLDSCQQTLTQDQISEFNDKYSDAFQVFREMMTLKLIAGETNGI